MPSVDILSPNLQKQNLIDLGVGSIPCQFSEEELSLAVSNINLGSAYHYGPHEGNDELRSLLAQEQGVPPEWIIITNGGSEAIALVYLALGSEKNILVPSTHFPAYRELALKFGIHINYYPAGKSAELVASEVIEHINKTTDLLVINSPLNPSGTAISIDNFSSILNVVSSTECFVMLDRTYEFLIWDNAYRLLLSRDTFNQHSRLILLGSISKRLGLAGLRLGYLIIYDSTLRNRIIELKMHLSMCTSVVSQSIGAYLLRLLTPEFTSFYQSRLRDTCRRLSDELFQQGFYSFFPKGGPFVVCKSPGNLDASELLKKCGILSLSLTAFGGSTNKARLCFARDDSTINEALKRLSTNSVLK